MIDEHSVFYHFSAVVMWVLQEHSIEAHVTFFVVALAYSSWHGARQERRDRYMRQLKADAAIVAILSYEAELAAGGDPSAPGRQGWRSTAKCGGTPRPAAAIIP
jgi:hypothetical protein